MRANVTSAPRSSRTPFPRPVMSGWPTSNGSASRFTQPLTCSRPYAARGPATETHPAPATSPRRSRLAEFGGLGAGRYAGLRGDVVLAGVDQHQDGHERRGDQPDPDPERDVVAVDRGERVERGR